MRTPGVFDCRIDIPKKSPTLSRRRRKKSSNDTNVLSSQKQSSSTSSNTDDKILSNNNKLTMKYNENNTNRHKEETQINIENLCKPIYLESMINNNNAKLLNINDNTNDDIVNLISTLLVTVERKIEKISMDDLIFPCPACRNIDTDDPLIGCKCIDDNHSINHDDNCHCNNNNDNTSKTFEVDGFKHIDSDDEEEVRMAFGKFFSKIYLTFL